MAVEEAKRIGVLWPGDRRAALSVTPEGCRLYRVFDALREASVVAEPVVYADEAVDAVRGQLLSLDGVLVWVNPIEKGRNRSVLDALLRDVAAAGVFVSAHPDVILKMGTKQVLYDTREIGWGSDTHVYRTVDALREELPARLAGGARVLKRHRGHSGIGIWKVELARPASELGAELIVRVREAPRSEAEQEIGFGDLVERMLPYFESDGRMIDQPYQERLSEGTVRCYLVRDKVAGFGHQAINALHPAPSGQPASAAPPAGPRLYSGPDDARFQSIKQKLENEWLGEMQRVLDIQTSSLPIIWDADFFYGPRTAAGADTFVLCEINVSCVSPFPDEALVPLAKAAAAAVE